MNPAKRILVIEDDRVIRQSIAAYMEDSGFEMLLSADGLSGLETFKEQHPDLVICDLRMPGLDGISVLHQISKDSPDTPIIVISGAGVIADVVEALRLGASDYLIKPILDMEMLEHSVHRSLERAELQRENASYREQLEASNREMKAHLQALQQDLLAGRHVQMKMLPAAPQTFSGYTFNHKVIPSMYLSGDFVEYITVGEDHVVFMIADVSGHGASSAFVTVLLKNLTARKRSDFSHKNSDAILSPAKLLAKANAELMEIGLGKHITMFVACLNLRTNELRFSNAGHLPCPILTTEHGTEFLEIEGFPVGIAPNTSYAEKTIQLPSQFRLMLFTDGILEILPQTDLVDKETELLRRCKDHKMNLSQLFNTLELSEVEAAPDDIAMLMIAKD